MVDEPSGELRERDLLTRIDNWRVFGALMVDTLTIGFVTGSKPRSDHWRHHSSTTKDWFDTDGVRLDWVPTKKGHRLKLTTSLGRLLHGTNGRVITPREVDEGICTMWGIGEAAVEMPPGVMVDTLQVFRIDIFDHIQTSDATTALRRFMRNVPKPAKGVLRSIEAEGATVYRELKGYQAYFYDKHVEQLAMLGEASVPTGVVRAELRFWLSKMSKSSNVPRQVAAIQDFLASGYHYWMDRMKADFEVFGMDQDFQKVVDVIHARYGHRKATNLVHFWSTLSARGYYGVMQAGETERTAREKLRNLSRALGPGVVERLAAGQGPVTLAP